MTHLRAALFILPVMLLGTLAARAGEPMAEGLEFFEKRIRPVLAEHCYKCHSAATRQRGGLKLDSKTALLKGGDSGPVVTPGKPQSSRLLVGIRYADPDFRMPPRSKLDDKHIADFVAWVKMGAPMPADAGAVVRGPKEFDMEERKKHWSFQPIRRVSPPELKRTDWPRTPVDRFLLAALEEKGLSPAPEADKRTLLRRITFDLIGLPPTPAEIDAFLKDTSPDAYEKVVERLLASPHHGERWGRHWLDLMRYAETQGHEFDFELPHAWKYRDYVVRAFNADLPYDKFVIEHVAGDLLENPRRHPVLGFNESIIGTGFWHLGEGKHSPVDIRAEGANRSDNQIDVFSKAFLGLTVACARCHDHKFDPISTRDYYALAGYLRSSRFQHAAIDAPGPRREILKKLRVVQKKARAVAVGVTAELIEQHAGEVAKRLKVEGSAKPQAEGRVFAEFTGDKWDDWFVTGEAFGDGPARAADVLIDPDAESPVRRLLGPGVAHSGKLGRAPHGALRSPTFTIDSHYILYRVAGRGARVRLIIDGFQIIRDPIYGGLEFTVNHGDEMRWHVMDVGMWVGHRAYVECLDEGDGFVALDRVLFSDHPSPPPDVNPLLAEGVSEQLLREIAKQWRAGKLDARPDAAGRADLLNRAIALLSQSRKRPPLAGSRADLAALLEEQRKLEASLPAPDYVMAMADGTGEDEFVFIRGSHKNLGDKVPRRFLEALAGKDQPAPAKGSGRLALARRMVAPSNPLLPRVMVNRLWHHHFGRGIVASVDDFGHQGQPPTYPRLLDWLASEFVRRGWSVKHMHRLMVLSSAYRMASRSDAKGDKLDPENKLLHRMPVRRLEAEAIRDAILAVSGRLDRALYGPGVLPHLTPFMQGRGRPKQSGPLDGDGRRSLYINVRRNFLTPLFLAFDYPKPFTCIGRRSVSNVPAQALTLMNNPFVRQQADLWAKRALSEKGETPRQRLNDLYETAFGRLPTEDEASAALAFLRQQSNRNDDPKAWAELCHVLYNVKEFIFVN